MQKVEEPKVTKTQGEQAAHKIIAEEPQVVRVDIKPKNFIHRFLIARGLMPSKRIFIIERQRVQNVSRIAVRRLNIDLQDLFTNTDRIGSLMRIMATNAEDLYYIVATAVQNDHREPTRKMIDIVKNEFEMGDLYNIMVVAVGNYDLSAFTATIALITGVNPSDLQASPKE